MLFTAPDFAFMFLPFSLLFYAIFGKKQKRLCFILIGMVYNVFLNMTAPVNMIWLPILVVYTHFASVTASRYKKKALTFVLCLVPILCLAGIRIMDFAKLYGFVYPTGITLAIFFSVSCIADRARNVECPQGFLHTVSYLTFYPLMIIGPFVKFSDFCKITEEDNIRFGIPAMADGVRLFCIGFVKRIAVGAVLVDGYQRIFAYSWESQSIVIVVLLLLLIYFGVFFSVSGYYDMAVGISKMYGFSFSEVNVNPFTIATVSEYSRGLFGSVRDWSSEYILKPLYGGDPHIPRFAKVIVYCLCTVMLVRFTPNMLLLIIPLIAFSMASEVTGLDLKHSFKKRVGLRAVFGLLTVLVMGAFWVFVTIGDGSVLSSIKDSGNAEYQTDMVLVSFSWIKYLLVMILGVFTVLPRTQKAKKITQNMPSSLRWIRDYGSMLIMLVTFLFAVLFFLPQFEEYCYTAFKYIVI